MSASSQSLRFICFFLSVELKEPLDEYISTHFPKGLVKLIRAPERGGLIKARMLGWKQSTGDVIVIFDSHMEVNVDW